MEQGIWRAVLVRMIRDLMSPSYACASDRTDAERWVGAWPSADFRSVCELAGFEPTRVHRVMKAICDISPMERGRFLEELDKRESGSGRWINPQIQSEEGAVAA